MATALVNGRVLQVDGFVSGLAVVLEGARIAAVVPEREARGSARVDLGGGLLLPGFIDVQVNGGGGVLFNDSRDVDTIRRIGAAHRQFGTTGFLPTLISDDLRVVEEAMRAADAAIQARVPGVLGIHVEGPFLNETRKGVHDASWFRELDQGGIRLLTSLRHGRTLVTLAPEMTTPGFIDELAAAGVIVCAGHTDASYEETREALKHGLAGFTHLFNAMSQLTSRRPGAVGAALEDQESWCGIIVDGQHVDPAVLRIALRCKRRDRFMLVTDAMPSVGTSQKQFILQGREIVGRRCGLRGCRREPRRLAHGHGGRGQKRRADAGGRLAGGSAHGQRPSSGIPRAGRRGGPHRAGPARQPRACRRPARRARDLDRRRGQRPAQPLTSGRASTNSAMRRRVRSSGRRPLPPPRLSAMWRALLVAGVTTVTAG